MPTIQERLRGLERRVRMIERRAKRPEALTLLDFLRLLEVRIRSDQVGDFLEWVQLFRAGFSLDAVRRMKRVRRWGDRWRLLQVAARLAGVNCK